MSAWEMILHIEKTINNLFKNYEKIYKTIKNINSNTYKGFS